ncbi:MAG TPA: hypothetical protein VL048_19665 [Xanthobacteraceae bacterium]|nr:hypothetical protein [Xanthobacteraceae bacterium]
MQLSPSRNPSRLPKRFPVGTTYVVEGHGGEDGELRVFSRYVVLPGGQRINLVDDFGGKFAGSISPGARRRRTSSRNGTSGRVKSAASRAKKIMIQAGTSRQRRR